MKFLLNSTGDSRRESKEENMFVFYAPEFGNNMKVIGLSRGQFFKLASEVWTDHRSAVAGP